MDSSICSSCKEEFFFFLVVNGISKEVFLKIPLYFIILIEKNDVLFNFSYLVDLVDLVDYLVLL